MAKLRVAGLVGSRVVELLSDEFEFTPLRYENGFDITNREIVWNELKELEFDTFLHLAAYTFVDKAEEENELCYKINVDGTKNVFEAIKQKGKKFIYISTDYVFNGTTPDVVFNENSKPEPVGVYGTSKYEGEKIVGNQGMIVRLAYPYRASFEKPDFVRKLKSLLEDGKELKMIVDSIID
ncbi:sugar nucleotide-binding protein [Candidatus Roizmanbacteria bacterium]|nr:sugar nucleotide-binding protein [Candidatus Roizmanbacteria bacterium]